MIRLAFEGPIRGSEVRTSAEAVLMLTLDPVCSGSDAVVVLVSDGWRDVREEVLPVPLPVVILSLKPS